VQQGWLCSFYAIYLVDQSFELVSHYLFEFLTSYRFPFLAVIDEQIKAQTTVGTPYYMSPEVLQGQVCLCHSR
jgi:hypothetical protein